jgi:cold shock CspA family protein
MDTTESTSATPTTSNKLLTGCVKWFNNSLNYGFITVLTEGEYLNMDIFSHQSNIKTKRECFRTLYTGECVQFELAKSNNDKHPMHAINISGFNGCLLHCENPSYRINSSNRGGNSGSRDGGGSSRDSSTRDGAAREGSSRGRGGSSRGASRGGSNDIGRGLNRSNSVSTKQ